MREGGLERVVAMLSAAQRQNGVHVAAVLEPREATEHPFVARIQTLGVPITTVVVGARSYWREYRELTALIVRLRPELVHTHGYRADLIGGAAARASHVPVVSTVHGFTGGSMRNRLYEALQAFALRRADAVIAVAAPLAPRLEGARVAPEKIHLIPNGFAPLNGLLTRDMARRRLGIGADALVVGWVGRLSKEKGPDVMLDAIAASDPSWRLSMIGEGAELGQLTQQATRLEVAERVTWHGAVAGAGTLLAAFDAFVLSSRTEGTPITLLEAMDACVPIVAARVGGVPDVVTPAHAILVPPEQPRAIATALAELQRDRSAAALRSKLARERLSKTFSAAAWVNAVDGVYRAARAHALNRQSN